MTEVPGFNESVTLLSVLRCQRHLSVWSLDLKTICRGRWLLVQSWTDRTQLASSHFQATERGTKGYQMPIGSAMAAEAISTDSIIRIPGLLENVDGHILTRLCLLRLHLLQGLRRFRRHCLHPGRNRGRIQVVRAASLLGGSPVTPHRLHGFQVLRTLFRALRTLLQRRHRDLRLLRRQIPI